jgi:hypothetical protein
MNTVKSLSRHCVLAALLLAAACFTPKASADLLTNTWFKLTLTAKGHTLETNNATVRRLNITRTVYLNFSTNTSAAATNTYRINLWTKTDAGWSNSYSTTESTIGLNENFISDFFLRFIGTGDRSLSSYHTPFIGTRRNSSGRLRSATYHGTGEIYNGTIDGKSYYGSFSLSGMTVRPSRLPFTP